MSETERRSLTVGAILFFLGLSMFLGGMVDSSKCIHMATVNPLLVLGLVPLCIGAGMFLGALMVILGKS